MTTITKKQILIDTANHIISRDDTSLYSENLRELARIALASLEAKTVVPTVLRRAPYWARAKSADPSQCYIAGWNACRAAMLNSPSTSKGGVK